MPNPPVAISGAIIVVSVAVAVSPLPRHIYSCLLSKAAIAVYESPHARQFAEDVRRRIALALHSLGDEINPNAPHPRFNRPEDAQGFLQSSAEPDIDADEESQRRQREELMYWNAVRAEKMEKERQLRRKVEGEKPASKSRSPSFDDFLQEDQTAQRGTYVYNTGTDVNHEPDVGLRNRGVRGLNVGSIYANPFSDEQTFEEETQRAIEESLMSPDASERLEVMSDDLYSASEAPRSSNYTTGAFPQLIDVSEEPVPDPPVSYPSMEELQSSTNFANMAEVRDNSAYASINAWSDNTTHSFYSPPLAPAAPGSPLFSDPPESVPGDLTPTDSVSLAGSAEEVWQPRSGATSEGDLMSVDGEGISTPGSWTEVGSVVSDNDVRH